MSNRTHSDVTLRPYSAIGNNWASAWDFQQCGMCDQQSIRSVCAYAQSDQSLWKSLVRSMIAKLLTEQHLEFLSLKGGCTCSYESTLVKMPHCWKVTCHGSTFVCFVVCWKHLEAFQTNRLDPDQTTPVVLVQTVCLYTYTCADPERGDRGSGPPEKSQKYRIT